MVSDTRALDDAIGWLVRQQDPAFADWASFTEWLEADPRNAAAYAELSARDAEVAEHLATIGIAGELAGEPLHVPQRNWTRRGFAIGGAALAASIVAVVGSYQLQPSQSLYSESTPPGVQRTVTLAGGATIGLNGGTHVVLDRRNPRFAELRSGEASFDIVHDADDPFRVVAGGAELVDLGTRFNVAFERGELEVGVSEGVVMYNPGAEAVRLEPGQQLRVAGGDLSLGRVDPAAVAAWREGRLVYQSEPLAEVARDLSRNIGIPVTVDRSLAARPVTAVVQLHGDRSQLAARLEKLLDLKVIRSNEGWILTRSG